MAQRIDSSALAGLSVDLSVKPTPRRAGPAHRAIDPGGDDTIAVTGGGDLTMDPGMYVVTRRLTLSAGSVLVAASSPCTWPALAIRPRAAALAAGSPRPAAASTWRPADPRAHRNTRTLDLRLRDECSASTWTAPDGSGLLTLDGSSLQTAPDGSRRIVGMIKAHPTKNRMARQTTLQMVSWIWRLSPIGTTTQMPLGWYGEPGQVVRWLPHPFRGISGKVHRLQILRAQHRSATRLRHTLRRAPRVDHEAVAPSRPDRHRGVYPQFRTVQAKP
jgi:hypothetical protein